MAPSPFTGEGRGEGLDHEEQRFLEDHHPGGGVHPDGSVDCLGNDLMYETVVDPSDSPV